MATNRKQRLREWMRQKHYTIRKLADDLGVVERMARQYLSAETISTKRHTQLVVLGFPQDLLPQPLDKKPGPKPLTPDYPGLRSEQHPAQATA